MSFALPHLDQVSSQPTIRQRIRALGGKRPANPEEPFPVTVDGDLVLELQRRFPNTCPEPGTNAHDAMLRCQGQQEVISFLLRIHEEQHPTGG